MNSRSVLSLFENILSSKKDTAKTFSCDKCGAGNCKLWRDYGGIGVSSIKCTRCIEIEDNVTYEPSEDQLSWYVPALPALSNDIYWGYTSAPQDAVAKWRALPTYSSESSTSEVNKDE
jgi:hypothetical protein